MSLRIFSRIWIACAIAMQAATACCFSQQASLDQKLQAYADQLTANETSLKLEPDNQTLRKQEITTATAAALEARRTNHMEESLTFLLRANYWVPNDAELLLNTGIQEESMKLYKDADKTLAQAQQLGPGELKTLYAIARVKMDLNQTQASEAAWRSYLEQRSEDASAHFGYGLLLQMLQRIDEAKAQFQKSIDLHPQQAESYYRLGEIARDAGDIATAKSNYEITIAHAPAHAGALTGLAILDYKAKQYDQAESLLEKATQYAPDFQTARYYHGLTLARLGRKQESEKELAIAIQIADAQNARKEQEKQLAAPYQPQ